MKPIPFNAVRPGLAWPRVVAGSIGSPSLGLSRRWSGLT
jgi:hypothetical protein